MIGYIVGYFDTWANERVPMIIGYYTTWENAVQEAIKQQRLNLDHHHGLRYVHVVEITADVSYPSGEGVDWIVNFPHYNVTTNRDTGLTILHNGKGSTFELELPPPTVRETPPPPSEWKPVRSRGRRGGKNRGSKHH